MSCYKYRINVKNCLKDDNNAVFKEIYLIGKNKSVLEIGCAYGDVTKYLVKNLNCKVTGVEIDRKAAGIAKRNSGAKIIIGDIETQNVWNKINKDKYDVIIFGDVLEHLRFPEKILQKSKSILNNGGYVIVSIPNIAHWSVRKNLLMGRFDYTDVGLLDRTHLRFFTQDSFEKMVSKCNYKIDTFDLSYKFPKDRFLPKKIKQRIANFWPNLFGWQLIYKISPKTKR